VNLTRTGTSTDLEFWVDVLELSGPNASTVFNLDGTEGADTGVGYVIFDGTGINSGRLEVNSRNNGAIWINAIEALNAKATIAIQDSSLARIDYFRAENADVTVEVPKGYDGSVPVVDVVVGLYVDEATIFLAGDVASFAAAAEKSLKPYLIKAPNVNYTTEPDVIVNNPNDPVWYDVDGWDFNGGVRPIGSFKAYASPALKALSEGYVAASAFLNRGSDLLVGDGIPQAVFSAAEAGLSFFSAVSYGHSRHDTGSHIDVDGLSLLLGASYGADVSVGRFTFGAFFELGDGRYDSYNDFTSYGDVNGSGDTDYVGGGLLARLDFGKSDSGFTYAEATFRAGRVSVDFESDDIGIGYRYDLDSTYYGFHVGLGHVFNITDATTLDLYGKWLFTHRGGNDFIAYGDNIRFDDVNSHRLRAGVKLTTEVNEMFKVYYGAAYEHELDGKARAWVRNLPVAVPELKGGTGIGELGLAVTAAEGLTLDIGVRGYVGTRRGINGTMNLTYSF
jgi:hypothetical protein